jgi:hypothetical protein
MDFYLIYLYASITSIGYEVAGLYLSLANPVGAMGLIDMWIKFISYWSYKTI